MTATEPTTCVCGGCGLVPVDEDYVSRQAARRQQPHPETGVLTVRPGLIASLRESYRPCHECRPEQYDRWRSGEYAPGSAPRRGARRAYRGRKGGDS